MAACAGCGYESAAPFRFCPECGAERTDAASHEQRRTVTLVFCDLAGSTSLGESVDPERLRALLARYFDEMRSAVERHGGSVEKFIGDAVMAVFGVPVLHEDDALRAVRAAVEMRDALPALGMEGRIGVMTGEVVTGTEERLATGDAVNVAARLEQAAALGEVLIGEPTLRLVRDAVEVEPVEPLVLKGKTEPVHAYRLLNVGAAPDRPHDTPFVGRDRELTVLHDAWERVTSERHCELVTVVGDAGVGKSRLIAEFLSSDGRRAVRGRCLPYGEGITYWPVVETLKQLDVLPSEEAAAAAIRTLLGERVATTSAEEIAWAYRKTLEHAAAERPLVVVFDDIQWGEQTFHDLVEHVALLSTGAPILLLCMARPELVERRPSWSVTLRLEPLGGEEVDQLIGDRVSSRLRERVARAAGGNPLFVAEILALALETDEDVAVPPTLQALLASRLDQLEPSERGVLERGAVEGEVFHRGAVQALAPEEPQVTPHLAALVRKQLIRPQAPQLAGDDGFRFRHLLIRDAAYDSLSKATRADLHQRFAAWLEQHGAGLVELDEILGYHLERAWQYRTELDLSRDDELAVAARMRLTAAARRAQSRSDHIAAARLLERAAGLMRAAEFDLGLESELVDALFWSGQIEAALRRAELIVERAATAGDDVGELTGRIRAGTIRTFLEPEAATGQLSTLIERALPVFEATGDDVALRTAYEALGQVANMQGRMDAALASYERADDHARRAGLPDRNLGWRGTCRVMGTTPVIDSVAWLEAEEARASRNHWLRLNRARVLAMLGRFDDARTILAALRVERLERGERLLLATTYWGWLNVELWAGNAAQAAEFGQEACRLLEELGERAQLSSVAGEIARALYAADELEEADTWADRSAELGASDDALTQMLWRQAKAKVLARRGEHAEAERLAREAVAIGEDSDFLDGQGDAFDDLAEVLVVVGKADEAAEALEQALERFERKGNVVS
ncbi:MAG: adenylate/guanylate cyclase domain-containing protein, partial [Actinobacteria bacterium]